MGRKKTYEERRVATAFRLPASIHARLVAAAEEREVSANFLATRAISKYLNELPRVSGEDGWPGRTIEPSSAVATSKETSRTGSVDA